ncbi:MAG: hypothetical protein Q9181_003463 [Wetmoreana brouardii]
MAIMDLHYCAQIETSRASGATLLDLSEYFRWTGAPFAITVGGQTLCILTFPEDIGAVYRNNTTLSWDAMLNDLLVGFGVNAAVIPKLLQKPHDKHAEKGYTNDAAPLGRCLSAIHSMLDLYKRQLLPGPKLDVILHDFIGNIDDRLGWERLEAFYVVTENSISLKPDLVQHVLDFNDDVWMLVYRVPQTPASKLSKARAKMLQCFAAYTAAPEEFKVGRSWVVENVIQEQQGLDISNQDRAAFLLMLYWAAHINPYRLGFWMLAYIISDQSLLATLRVETAAAYQHNKINVSHVMNDCPRFEAVYWEVMRVTNGALSARKIVAPTPMGDKVLQPGNTILLSFRQLHHNKDVFGQDPRHFGPERFLKDASLKNNASYKPFGGGVNYCPGRFLAKQEMLVFTALCIKRFVIEIAGATVGGKAVCGEPALPALDIAFSSALQRGSKAFCAQVVSNRNHGLGEKRFKTLLAVEYWLMRMHALTVLLHNVSMQSLISIAAPSPEILGSGRNCLWGIGSDSGTHSALVSCQKLKIASLNRFVCLCESAGSNQDRRQYHMATQHPTAPDGSTSTSTTQPFETAAAPVTYLAGWHLAVVTVSLCLGTSLIALDINIIGVAVPKIAAVFSSLDDIAWYGSAYLLTVTAFQPVTGFCYKYFKVRATYLASILIFEGSGVLMLGFGYLQWKRGEDAIVPLRILGQRSVFAGAMFLFFYGVLNYTYSFFLPFYFQAVQGSTAIRSGVQMIPLVISQVTVLIAVGAITTKWGHYVPYMVVGQIICVVGSGLLTRIGTGTPTIEWASYLVITGFGLGMAQQLPYTAIQVVLSEADTPTGNAILVFWNQLGGVIAIPVCQALLIGTLRGHLARYSDVLPTESVVHAGPYELQRLTQGNMVLLEVLRKVYALALKRVYIFALAAGCVGWLFTLAMERKNIKREQEARQTKDERA